MVCNAEGFVQIVRHHDAGQAQSVVELSNQTGRSAQRNGVQTGKGFVVHDQFGVERDGSGQGHTACHAARNFRGHQIPGTAQTDRVQLHQHNVPDQFGRQIAVLAQGESDVVKDTQIGEQSTKLEQHAHATTGLVKGFSVGRVQTLPVENHFTALWADLPADQPQHRGFTAPRSPHQGGYFAFGEAQTEVTQDRPAPITKGQVLEFDQR